MKDTLPATKQPRDSSIELLRILSMVMIVFHHFALYGQFVWDTSTITIPYAWYNLILLGGRIGSNIFVLISGYFLILSTGKLFNFKRILKLWGQIFFYSFAVFLIFDLLIYRNIGIQSMISVFFPVTFSKWWFAGGYFVLYLLHPFLNAFLNHISKAVYQKLLVLLVICWSIIPTFTTAEYGSNELLWFITLYTIAGYIRLYGLNPKITAKHYFILWVLFSVLTYGSTFVLTILGNKIHPLASHIWYFYGREKINILICSVCLFMIFTMLKMNYSKWINVTASAAFGVYLIHESIPVKQFLWEVVCRNNYFQDSWLMIPHSILAAAFVYIVCTSIDLLRQRFFEKPFMVFVDRYSEKIMIPVEKTITFAKGLVFGK